MIDPDAVASTLEAVLSFPSPQPQMDAVREFIATTVRRKAETGGFDSLVIDSGGNLIARRHGTNPALRPLVWYTYGATYPPAGMVEPYPARRVLEEGVLHLRGRGAAEQRTGLAAALEALRGFASRRPVRGYVFVTSVAGEMGNHLVAEALLREHSLRAAAIVVAVATGGKIGLGNLGRVDISVEVTGVPCHSSDPAKGVNAVEGAIEFCRRLQRLPPLAKDPDLGQATIAITGISSEPQAPHTIPARCVITIDRRLVPGEDPLAATAQIAKCAEGIAPPRVTVRAGHSSLPGKLSADHPLPQLAAAAARQVDLEPAFFYRRAALDAGYFIKLGMPTIMWGPGDPALAHTDEERVRLEDAATAAQAYYVLTALACWDRPDALEGV